MKKLLLGLAFATTLAVPVSLAADLEPPPPVDMRPATYDWSGAYIGAFGNVVAEDGHYVARALCGCPSDPEMDGIGYGAGVLAGINYQVDNFVLGIEGDWAFGGLVGDNSDPSELTELSFDNIGTLRARAGFAQDYTLLYLTGGLAVVDTEFSGEVGPIGASTTESDNAWLYGWTIGGGIEHAFTDSLHARLEYLWVGLPDHTYDLTAGTVDQVFGDIHMVRAGLTYNFSW